ncbi:MAG: DUF1592 domain-containing protein [Mariniblastus sp.]
MNFETLGHDLTDVATFRKWESVFDRVAAGEMPPAAEDRPDSGQLKIAQGSLKKDLLSASVARQQRIGRVPARRLTKRELRNTIQDLFLIDHDVTGGIPEEVDAGTFDTVGELQRISAVHMESYLAAADEALDQAMLLGKSPYRDFGDLADDNFARLEQWHDKALNQGGNITRKLKFGNGVALFNDVDYVTQFTYDIRVSGVYRLTANLAGYQSRKPVTAKFIAKDPSGGVTVLKSIDLERGKPQTVVVEAYLNPGTIPYLTVDIKDFFFRYGAFNGAKNYRGPGLAIMSQKIEGPIFETWPPPSTRKIFKDMLDDSQSDFVKLKLTKDPTEHLKEIVTDLAPDVFRRTPTADEVQSFVNLAKPALEEGRSVSEAAKVSLRSMLTSPQFLMFAGEAGVLDEFALASRLSYFLWRTMPDSELFEVAKSGQLSDPNVLRSQVERMLADKKSERFVNDFLGQWLWLHKLNATSPDDGLYPEFDELLDAAIPREPELFFGELIKENMSLTNLIDSDFTFLNRRLAQLYGIKGVEGQHFRRVSLPSGSPRGGVLTQAAILKTTANGTTTSPVTRGNFVLTNIFGTPPSPPPPGIGSIEPDTRGKTTIREILKAHREMDSCNQCHREIDPPGFALESFDPIGGFRTSYRVDGGSNSFGGFVKKNPPEIGQPVDPSGITSDGKKFADVNEYKKHLLEDKEKIARNFISRLVVFSTGAEIQFADREAIEAIVGSTSKNGFRVKDIIHEIIQSQLFTHK